MLPVIAFSIRARAAVGLELDSAGTIAELTGVAVQEVADAVTVQANGRVGMHVGMMPSRGAVAAVDTAVAAVNS